MPSSPTPPAPTPYRGPLRFMEGAPLLEELAMLGALFVGGVLLLLIGWRLFRGYFRDRWNGFFEPSSWQLLWAAASAAAGGGSLWMLWPTLSTSPLGWASVSPS